MINEILFGSVAIMSFVLILAALKLGKDYVLVIPPVYLILANIFAPQFVTFFGLTTTLAVPIYASIFLATDIIAEHYGKKEAYKVVWAGLLSQIALVVFSQLVLHAEVIPMNEAMNEALKVVFSFTPRLVAGSFVAYMVSQHYDVWFFHLLKDKFKGRHIWLRNNMSTMTSQFIDTAILISIAFWGILPNLFTFILVVWVVKVLIAASDTPFIYLSYKILKKPYPKQG